MEQVNIQSNTYPPHTSFWWNALKRHGELIAALVSGIIIAFAWLMEGAFTPSTESTLYIIAFIIGGFAKAKEGITDSIADKDVNVELLMIIAAVGAGSIGYWTEGAILIFIFALSGALETYTLNKSERELESLMDIQPETATILENGNERIVSADSLLIGNMLLIRPGERVPADGIIIKGQTSVDQSAITGESLPVTKQIDEEVYAGTLNISGHLTVKMTKRSEDTVFQKIITLVQEAQDQKAPSQLFIEKLEGWYVKSVLSIGALLMVLPHYALGWTWDETIYRAMVFLVVASPCALVASIMPATLSAISAGARTGILFKGGVHLEQLGTMKAVALDKTGTLTEGSPVVTDVFTRDDIEEDLFIKAVASIERQSTHPLGKAIVNYAGHIDWYQPDQMMDHSGWGVEAKLGETTWRVGKLGFFSDKLGFDTFHEQYTLLQQSGKTIVIASDDNGIAGMIALKDKVRSESNAMVKALKKRGIEPVMLTGDSEQTAKAIAEEVGIKTYYANCLPEDKVKKLKELKMQYGTVGMIGDGINDAPALAVSDVGIAMGQGTDVALESADVVLMKNDLGKLTQAVSLSNRLNLIVKQNVIFSISIILILIASNFFQFLTLPLGVIGHEGSTILVILNGLRLLK
ncbi:cadmium-translocating P-type ATPase [Pseudalkalibacillus hwajinpoensis]|uniref:Cadmium-translocating P-type ATPase n=2 Tax=Guptibacillus hwajinpoensis TaxID=208199 RepID=A0A4V5PZ19_9BACL|nr:heavy metal translocating P-type ATPase [Pseudalkalibacillus hwajinpoensis]TKD68318.1 cadmium-translocating P-type ATPase [Pseudalkalibacillus hwajinpoensis]